jgi:XTP/dITP diphosphohydrolase
MARVERALEAKGACSPEARRANFTCALAVAWPDGHLQIFEGQVHGHLVWPPRGTRGFGYDPIFVADGHEVTFGEMAPAEKHAISHRARAFAKFVATCLAQAHIA